MNTVRLNITLSKKLGNKLRNITNKSSFIARALEEKLALKNKEEKLRKLLSAYQEAAQEEASLLQDWDATAGDGL